MKRRILVLQHTYWERPGQFLLRAATSHGVHLDIVEVWHEPIPEICVYHGLIVLGGSPHVDQEGRYPFLKAEKAIIRRAVYDDMPYLGFCLGHQILAQILGATVGANFRKSVGFVQCEVTKNGCLHPIFQGIPRSFFAFKWHSQAVLPPLPKHLQVLATSKDCQVEAISLEGRPHIIGLQFDNHAASASDVKEWVDGDGEWLSRSPKANSGSILNDAMKMEGVMGAQFDIMFSNYLKFAL
jgi:GMP synthase (glutamine-hydrolysing)